MAYHSPKTTKPIKRILTTSFCPLPTVKSVQTKHSLIPRVVYEAAHHLFHDYPMHKRLLIHQFQREEVGYEVYIERIHNGWKDTIRTYSVTDEKKAEYMIDGLREAIKEEKEMQPLLPHMAKQLDMMCRLLNL